jgi:hypothetical protein
MAEAKLNKPDHTLGFIPSETRDAVFLGNPVLDSMMHVILALGAEVWAGKRRLKVVESLLAAKQPVTAETIEAYVPTSDEEKAWTAERDQIIQLSFGGLVNGGGASKAPAR